MNLGVVRTKEGTLGGDSSREAPTNGVHPRVGQRGGMEQGWDVGAATGPVGLVERKVKVEEERWGPITDSRT